MYISYLFELVLIVYILPTNRSIKFFAYEVYYISPLVGIRSLCPLYMKYSRMKGEGPFSENI